MPGMARSRRHPRSWSAAMRSTRPRATSRAARTMATERPALSPHASRRAGATPAIVSALGTSRRPVSGQRRPRPKTTRRWIAAARGLSISCSQIAHARASNGSGRRRTRSHGARRSARPMQRVPAEALVERTQVVVDAEGEAHALDTLPGGLAESARARRRRPAPAGAGRRARRRPPPPRGSAARARRRAAAPSRRARRTTAGGRATRGRTSTRSSHAGPRGRATGASRARRAGAGRPGTTASPRRS